MVSYRDAAACRHDLQDPERWFPISPRAAELDPHPVAVCGLCPVRTECLQDALTHSRVDGTWGGLNEWERKPLHARHRQIVGQTAEAQGSETPIGLGHAG